MSYRCDYDKYGDCIAVPPPSWKITPTCNLSGLGEQFRILYTPTCKKKIDADRMRERSVGKSVDEITQSSNIINL
ncbi:MAG: hypothetical protein ABIB79_00720 [archaeon]